MPNRPPAGTPSRRSHIVSRDGFARAFTSDWPLETVDLDTARIQSGPFTLPPTLARTRLKEWQHVCIVAPDLLITLAVVDVKFAKLAWFQVVRLSTGERWEHHRQSPIADAQVARSLWDEHTHYRARGFELSLHAHLDAQRHVIDVKIAAGKQGPAMRGSWTIAHDLDAVSPLVVSLPLGRKRCLYSHKVPLPVLGTLTMGGEDVSFGSDTSVAILDIHKAHYPRHMFWKWATCAGHLPDGRIVGINLTKNVIRDDVSWNENCIWLDGTMMPVGPALFDIDASSPDAPWHVSSVDDRVRLRFEPLGSRSENTHVPGIATSRFKQHYGRFSGTISTPHEALVVEGLLGLCEDHESVW